MHVYAYTHTYIHNYNNIEYLIQKHIHCKNNAAKLSRIIPGSECTNRLATTGSDIRMQPRSLLIAYQTHKYYTAHIIAN